MSHLKRQKVPKSWPIHRKGTTWVVGGFNIKHGIPILIILRDMLNITHTKKEAKKALHERQILLNGKVVRDEKNSVVLLDVITIVPSKENYRMILSEKGKFKLEKIKESEAGYKISKIINKKMLKGKKIQLNLIDGRNVISDIKCKTNDSVIISLKTGKIEKCFSLKEKAKVMVIGGKHAGVFGEIEKIDEKHKIVELKHLKDKINVLIKHLIIIE